MTITEAARSLGLSVRTLQEQAARGHLRATRHGRAYWVTEGAVEDYRREHLGKVGRPRKETRG